MEKKEGGDIQNNDKEVLRIRTLFLFLWGNGLVRIISEWNTVNIWVTILGFQINFCILFLPA